MSLIPRLSLTIPNGWGATALWVVLLAASVAGVGEALRRLPALPCEDNSPNRDSGQPGSNEAHERPLLRSWIPLEAWSVFRPDGDAVGPDMANAVAARFRLAGTFLVRQAGESSRKAVIVDRTRALDLIVAEGELLEPGLRVQAIGDGRVELNWNGVLASLELASDPSGPAGSNASPSIAAGSPEDTRGYEVLRRGRFGLQVDADRWLLDRRKVLDYYNEVLSDADRLVALFDSLKPLYDANRKIGGYLLIQEGEQTFFAEAGLKEGDILRKVNKMPLLNRRVAEQFIRDFAENNLSAAVLDIERDGRPATLVYEFR